MNNESESGAKRLPVIVGAQKPGELTGSLQLVSPRSILPQTQPDLPGVERGKVQGDVDEPAHNDQFVCHVCGKKFIREIFFKQHMISHPEEAGLVFSCPRCTKCFYSEEYLQLHMRTHAQMPRRQRGGGRVAGSGERNKERFSYCCNLCTFQSTSKSGLKDHMTSHLKACGFCVYKTTDAALLRRHLQIQHSHSIAQARTSSEPPTPQHLRGVRRIRPAERYGSSGATAFFPAQPSGGQSRSLPPGTLLHLDRYPGVRVIDPAAEASRDTTYSRIPFAYLLQVHEYFNNNSSSRRTNFAADNRVPSGASLLRPRTSTGQSADYLVRAFPSGMGGPEYTDNAIPQGPKLFQPSADQGYESHPRTNTRSFLSNHSATTTTTAAHSARAQLDNNCSRTSSGDHRIVNKDSSLSPAVSSLMGIGQCAANNGNQQEHATARATDDPVVLSRSADELIASMRENPPSSDFGQDLSVSYRAECPMAGQAVLSLMAAGLEQPATGVGKHSHELFSSYVKSDETQAPVVLLQASSSSVGGQATALGSLSSNGRNSGMNTARCTDGVEATANTAQLCRTGNAAGATSSSSDSGKSRNNIIWPPVVGNAVTNTTWSSGSGKEAAASVATGGRKMTLESSTGGEDDLLEWTPHSWADDLSPPPLVIFNRKADEARVSALESESENSTGPSNLQLSQNACREDEAIKPIFSQSHATDTPPSGSDREKVVGLSCPLISTKRINCEVDSVKAKQHQDSKREDCGRRRGDVDVGKEGPKVHHLEEKIISQSGCEEPIVSLKNADPTYSLFTRKANLKQTSAEDTDCAPGKGHSSGMIQERTNGWKKGHKDACIIKIMSYAKEPTDCPRVNGRNAAVPPNVGTTTNKTVGRGNGAGPKMAARMNLRTKAATRSRLEVRRYRQNIGASHSAFARPFIMSRKAGSSSSSKLAHANRAKKMRLKRQLTSDYQKMTEQNDDMDVASDKMPFSSHDIRAKPLIKDCGELEPSDDDITAASDRNEARLSTAGAQAARPLARVQLLSVSPPAIRDLWCMVGGCLHNTRDDSSSGHFSAEAGVGDDVETGFVGEPGISKLESRDPLPQSNTSLTADEPKKRRGRPPRSKSASIQGTLAATTPSWKSGPDDDDLQATQPENVLALAVSSEEEAVSEASLCKEIEQEFHLVEKEQENKSRLESRSKRGRRRISFVRCEVMKRQSRAEDPRTEDASQGCVMFGEEVDPLDTATYC